MPKGIDKSDWDMVHQMAVDAANAAIMDDNVLLDFKIVAMLDLLSRLQKKYGDHPSLIATIGDYLGNPIDRRKQYEKALAIAKEQQYQEEIEEIEDSLRKLEKEISQP